MAIAELDQVTWKELYVSTGGTPAAYVYGDLLPAASTAADLVTRKTFRSAGATRRVITADSAEDLAASYATAAAKETAREAAETGTAATTTPVIPIVGGLAVVENVT